MPRCATLYPWNTLVFNAYVVQCSVQR
jgi:hypothetical protein